MIKAPGGKYVGGELLVILDPATLRGTRASPQQSSGALGRLAPRARGGSHSRENDGRTRVAAARGGDCRGTSGFERPNSPAGKPLPGDWLGD
jgi:hypothetical protein